MRQLCKRILAPFAAFCGEKVLFTTHAYTGENMANVNEGHRARLRRRMMTEGLHGFQDHEILELLLFQSLPRKDTNKIAHDLLNKFGSLSNVLDASPEQLQTVKGISEVAACNLAVLKEVWLRYKTSASQKRQLSKLSSIVQYAKELVAESYVEKLVVVFLDNATNFLVSEVFTSDDTQEVHVDLKKLVASAVRSNAAGAMLFHCHVKGECQPSSADVSFTEKLYVTFANINIMLLEHIIFNDTDEYYSFYKEGKMAEIAERYKSSLNSAN